MNKTIMIALALALVMSVGMVSAQHDADVTLSPDVANCNSLGDTFTVTIENTGEIDSDSILQVEVYKALAGLSNFVCGPAPTGWDLFSYSDRCIYVTELNSSYKIAPGQSLSFDFDAVMKANSCNSEFVVATVDDESQTGERRTYRRSVAIDCSAPFVSKTVGDPKLPLLNGGENDYWITQSTLLTAYGADNQSAGECDLGLDTCVITYMLDGEGPFNVTSEDFDPETYDWSHEWTFGEDSMHVINITCTDVAGNVATLTETDRVDDTAPETTKTFVGPQKKEGDIEWIDSVTTIELTAQDPDPTGEQCNIGVDNTYYRITQVDDALCENPAELCQPRVGDLKAEQVQIQLPDFSLYEGPIGDIPESCHMIEYYSIDELGNEEDVQANCFFVDKTPPVMDKVVEDPKVMMCNDTLRDPADYHLALDETNFSAQEFPLDLSVDWDCSGVTWNVDYGDADGSWSTGYQVIVSDGTDPLFTLGWSPDESTTSPVYKDYSGSWGAATTTLPDGMSVSGAYNDKHYEVFVPWSYLPEGFEWAVNTEATWPQHSGSEQQNYPADWQRWTGNNMAAGVSVLDWYVTPETDIDLSCVDPEPHPSGGEVIHWTTYRSTDGETWDVEASGDENGQAYTLNFAQASLHRLEWYCTDAVDKTSQTDVEYFKVDDEPPVITKDVEGVYSGDCPPENGDETAECYLKGTEANVTVSVADTQAIHMVDDVTCEYSVEWNNDVIDSDVFGEEGMVFSWDEDSEHILSITCQDALGNEATDVERFLVDVEPPVTTKTYGDPTVTSDGYRWITSATPINLSAWDEKVGVEGIYYKYAWVSNETCEAHPGVPVTSGYVPPSTNDLNRAGENPLRSGIGPHVDLVEQGVGYVVLDFINQYNYDACFEYMTDGNTSQSTGANDNPAVPDLYPFTCVKAGTTQINISADMFVDVRLVFGAERDWDFDWTRFDVLPDASAMTYVEGDHAEFSIPEESCHVIEYYSVDEFGNEEPPQYQYVIVDNSAPNMTKTIGEPHVIKDETDYITQDTQISLVCNDVMPHPVGRETFEFRYRLSDDCVNFGAWSAWSSPDGDFSFAEDSCHELEYRCVDGLGNAAQTRTEIDVVDTAAPVIESEIRGPTITRACDLVNEGGSSEEDCIVIDGVTRIWVGAYDPDPHPVGEVTCEWSYDWEGETYGPYSENASFEISGWDESRHDLTVTCSDALGNEETFEQTYYVDKTAPFIWKDYDLLYSDVFEDGNESYWAKFTGVDEVISAGVDDVGPHLSGIQEVEYKVSLVDDELCRYSLPETDGELQVAVRPKIDYMMGCEEASGEGGWITVSPEDYDEFEFSIGEESCHMIEIMATDNVEKCALHKQFVYVDDTPPETAKVIGEPKSPMSEGNIAVGQTYYPELSQELCDGSLEKCMDVTLLTSIDLACEDPAPHPSGADAIYFMVDFDGADVTQQYCGAAGGEYVDDVESEHFGFCYLAEGASSFYFTEESWHKLTYYCEDNVGNVEPENADVEYFKVEGTAFNITLNGKWNLFSVPVKLQDNSMDEVFAGHDEVVSVWTYDGSDWFVYTPDGDATNDNLHTMVPGDGYWLLSDLHPSEQSWLLIGGSLLSPQVTPPDKAIVEGWNLIGYYGVEGAPVVEGIPSYQGPDLYGAGKPVGCALDTLLEEFGDNLAPSLWTYWQPDNPDMWKQLDDRVHFMNPGAGYWLFYNQEGGGIYAPATGCSDVPVFDLS